MPGAKARAEALERTGPAAAPDAGDERLPTNTMLSRVRMKMNDIERCSVRLIKCLLGMLPRTSSAAVGAGWGQCDFAVRIGGARSRPTAITLGAGHHSPHRSIAGFRHSTRTLGS